MNVLIIGSGGREHALVWKIKQSPNVTKIYCAPGNGGIARNVECVNLKVDDLSGLLKFAQEKNIDLTVVGPEIPLTLGIVDLFEQAGLKIFGPHKGAAQLEGSKFFSKEFMRRHRIPTAEFQVFTDIQDARHVLKVTPSIDYPIVVKADGLAAGKGVMICKDYAQVETALVDILDKRIFQEAGARVIIEDGLAGEEASILALCDGQDFVILEPAQDHKRIFDQDKGPNTGGMGAYSPVPCVSQSLMDQVAREVFVPTLKGMAKEGNPFKGILYAGIMLTKEGPKVLEFNVRFGDPEAQVVIPRLKDDLVDLMLAVCDGKLGDRRLTWDKRSAVCVVMAAGGYPGSSESDKEIFGLDQAEDIPSTMVFHAGTKMNDGKIFTSGGRVLGVTALGDNIQDAINQAYSAVNKISFSGCQFRRDIGARAIAKVVA